VLGVKSEGYPLVGFIEIRHALKQVVLLEARGR